MISYGVIMNQMNKSIVYEEKDKRYVVSVICKEGVYLRERIFKKINKS